MQTSSDWLNTAVFVGISVLATGAVAETRTLDIHARFGTTAEGIREAILEAKDHFRNSPNDVVVLQFGE